MKDLHRCLSVCSAPLHCTRCWHPAYVPTLPQLCAPSLQGPWCPHAMRDGLRASGPCPDDLGPNLRDRDETKIVESDLLCITQYEVGMTSWPWLRYLVHWTALLEIEDNSLNWLMGPPSCFTSGDWNRGWEGKWTRSHVMWWKITVIIMTAYMESDKDGLVVIIRRFLPVMMIWDAPIDWELSKDINPIGPAKVHDGKTEITWKFKKREK